MTSACPSCQADCFTVVGSLQGLAGETDLTEAVLKNVYANDATHKSDAAALTRYMRRHALCQGPGSSLQELMLLHQN